ncbi:MAG TPA: bacteriohopanetetrol glucosamine biosynthesis glycosyltransferase HpnI [Verrucomicrobiae bacterium]|nr:bacteriohopanetetrol glucosamine biosynthesis glycosyltransferase HpnI [Verrucomicrobiae bacterium]
MIHYTARILQFVAILGCISSSIYYLICLWASAVFLHESEKAEGLPIPGSPPISILKPLKGTDPNLYESLRSHCLQEYPEYEIIFGISDPADRAADSVRHLQREFPRQAIRLVVCPEVFGTNVKVSNLEQMARAARYEYLVVNDSDIKVGPDYLRKIARQLAGERVGMVTCLYRGVPEPTLGSVLESLGISTDFCAGVLAARQLEHGLRFGLGSTLAFRRADLEQVGGFRSIVDFLADDYELGRRIADLGKQVTLSEEVVETHLPAYHLGGFWSHQLRWARGVRDARLGGYVGLASTFGLVWAILAVAACGGALWSWIVLGVVLLLRTAVALTVGKAVLRDQGLAKHLWLLPFRDLIAVGVWLVSFAGHTVTWRGERFELKDGRLIRPENRRGLRA